jgi:helicase
MKVNELPLPKNFIDLLDVRKLNPPQIAALKEGLLERKNLVIASPTASGKTLIAEIAFLRNFLDGGKSLYIVPLKALASEKFNEFSKYKELGMRIAISVGDLDSSDEWLGNYDLVIVSNEKADSLLRHGAGWMRNLTLVIADEIHLLNDPSRGPTLEIVLTRLRQITNSQVIALSATIENAKDIAEWLDAKAVRSNYRPIKLFYGIYYPYTLEFEDKENLTVEGKDDLETLLAKDTLQRRKQALIFLATRRSAEAAAEKISNKTELSESEKKSLAKIAREIENALSNPTKQCKRLARIVSRGCAFHHAGLVAKQRKLIEDNFRLGLIKTLTSTPTLAFGVNLPSWRVIIRDVRRYSGYGSSFIPVLEVQQMCGRAGRPKYDKEGEAILIAKTSEEAEALKEKYIFGEPEPIYSKLSAEPMLRMHVLALIANEVTKKKSELREFFSRTFFAYQYRDIDEVMKKINKILKELERYKFIKIGKEPFISGDFVPAFDLNRDLELKATRIGKRVAELYIDPVSANFIIKNMRMKNDIESLLTIDQCIEMEPLLRVRKNEHEDLEDELARRGINAPDVWDLGYDEFLMAFKTSLMFNDWMNELGEDRILDKYGIAPGELYSKLLNAGWMLYSAKELAILLNKRDDAKIFNKLKMRIKHGVKEELLPLIRIKNIGRVRARLLWRNRIKSVRDLKKAPLNKLERILGPNIARMTKKELSVSLDERMKRIKRHR